MTHRVMPLHIHQHQTKQLERMGKGVETYEEALGDGDGDNDQTRMGSTGWLVFFGNGSNVAGKETYRCFHKLTDQTRGPFRVLLLQTNSPATIR